VVGVNEAQWRRQVLDIARAYGWRSYSTTFSPYSTPGWPDLALVRPPTVILAELKTERGKVSTDQRDTLELLDGCNRVLSYLWRPDELDAIAYLLKGVTRER
jgi:hypothetical protein